MKLNDQCNTERNLQRRLQLFKCQYIEINTLCDVTIKKDFFALSPISFCFLQIRNFSRRGSLDLIEFHSIDNKATVLIYIDHSGYTEGHNGYHIRCEINMINLYLVKDRLA